MPDALLRFIYERDLCGKDIGWIDAHLLTSARISNCGLWSLDKALARAVVALGNS